MNEHEITALLERAGSGLRPDVADLVATGAARGRARRRRRQSGATLLAGAVAAGAIAAGPHLSLPGSGPAGEVGTAASPSSGPREVAVPPEGMAHALAGRLAGGALTDKDPESFRTGVQGATVLWRGYQVSLTIDTRSAGSPGTAEDRCAAANGTDFCVAGPDGSSLVTYTQGGPGTGAEERVVRDYTADGYVVEASADRASGDVDDDLLTRLATDGGWFR